MIKITLLFILTLTTILCNAQDIYRVATDNTGICLNSFEKTIKSCSTSVVKLNLAAKRCYRVRMHSNGILRIDVKDKSIYFESEKELEFWGNETIILYLNNEGKKKVKVAIAIIALNK